MNNSNRMGILLGVVLITLITSALVIQVALAQSDDLTPPAGTSIAQGGALRTQAAQTAQAVQTQVASTSQAGQSQLQGTVQAGQTQVVSTSQAVQTNVSTTADVARTEVNATVDAASTRVVSTVDAVQTNAVATVDTMRTEVVATLQVVADELEDALSVINANFDAETGIITLTTTFDESQVNNAVNIALQTAGYTEINATIDLVDNGMVITLENVTLENGAVVTAVMTFELVQNEDQFDLVLTSVTVNDFEIPEDQIDVVLQSYIERYIEDILNGMTTDFNESVPDGAVVESIEVNQVLINDNLIAVIVLITLST